MSCRITNKQQMTEEKNICVCSVLMQFLSGSLFCGGCHIFSVHGGIYNVCMWVHVPQHTCGNQGTTYGSWFSLHSLHVGSGDRTRIPWMSSTLSEPQSHDISLFLSISDPLMVDSTGVEGQLYGSEICVHFCGDTRIHFSSVLCLWWWSALGQAHKDCKVPQPSLRPFFLCPHSQT